ncbi:WD40 repeat domain-containing protein [Actinoplanes sichuanensis]|uniref:WD40 repeat domain-containing protein n=1 Tax=Actinoplanes sichuanensis TaxID=512349 RepID=A0ABW4AYD9_9ACTN|nr:hypothetical protein [Actinoplanes sichuanensis]
MLLLAVFGASVSVVGLMLGITAILDEGRFGDAVLGVPAAVVALGLAMAVSAAHRWWHSRELSMSSQSGFGARSQGLSVPSGECRARRGESGSATVGALASEVRDGDILLGDVMGEPDPHDDLVLLPRRLLLAKTAVVGLGVVGVAAASRYVTGIAQWGTLPPDPPPTPAGTDGSYVTAGRPLRPAGDTVWSVAVGMLKGEPLAVVGGDDGTVQLLNPVTGVPRSGPIQGHHRPVYSIALHDTMAVSASVDGTLRVWNLTDDPPTSTPTTDVVSGGINGVALGAVGGRAVAVTASADGTVRIWDPTKPQLTGRILGEKLDEAVNSIAVGTIGDKTTAVTGSGDGRIRLWDVSGERLIQVLGTHDGPVWAMAVGTVGGQPVAVSGGEDGELRLWLLGLSPPVGRVLAALPKAVKAVVIGEVYGRTVAVAGSDDSSIRLWDLATGRPYGAGLTGPTTAAQSIAISSFGGRPTVVSGHWDGTIWTWVL